MSQKTNNSKNDIYAMVETKYLEITKKQIGKEVKLEQLEPYTKEFINMLYNNVNSVRVNLPSSKADGLQLNIFHI